MGKLHEDIQYLCLSQRRYRERRQGRWVRYLQALILHIMALLPQSCSKDQLLHYRIRCTKCRLQHKFYHLARAMVSLLELGSSSPL